MSENILYEASFKVTEVNSAKYDRVSRFTATDDQNADTACMLDVNTELYPIEVDDRLTLAIALSLNLDGSKDDSKGWRNVGRGEATLADEYDYVMHGKIYRFDEGEGQNMCVSDVLSHCRSANERQKSLHFLWWPPHVPRRSL